MVYNQTVDFATSMSIPLLEDIVWDGIVGLGFRNEEQRRRGTFPVWDTLQQQKTLTRQGLRNQFSYFISGSGGKIIFGGADMSLLESPEAGFTWVSVEPSSSYWTVHVLRAEVLGGDLWAYDSLQPPENHMPIGRSGKGGNSILDTGTYLIYR